MLNRKSFFKILNETNVIDILEYFPATNLLRITKNPYGFINLPNGQVKYNSDNSEPLSSVDINKFKKSIKKLLSKNGYTIIQDNIVYYKKFPDTEKEFNKYFIDNKNHLKHKLYFQKKIVGMTSYLGDKKELMPDIIIPSYSSNSKTQYKDEEMHIISLPMNENILRQYSERRALERSIDLNNKKRNKSTNDKTVSSYRMPRSVCNFIFPNEITRPIPNNKLDKMNENLEVMEDKELRLNDGLKDTSDTESKKSNSK